jgi:hypothetical protein
MSHQGRVFGGMGADATDRLAALDSAAHSIRAYSPLLMPGLLQTARYAAGVIHGRTPSLPPEEVTHRMRARWARNERFLERWARPQNDGFAWFVMGEAAIRQPECNIPGHANQLNYLVNLISKYPRVKIQLLPDDAAHGIEPFSIHHLDDGQRVAHLESFVGGWYSTAPEDVARLHQAFSEMMKRAYDPQATYELIKEALYSCWGPSAEPSTSSPPTQTPTTASSWPVRPRGPLA